MKSSILYKSQYSCVRSQKTAYCPFSFRFCNLESVRGFSSDAQSQGCILSYKCSRHEG